MSKSKCFILCNVNNALSSYLFASNAGSNLSYYIANSLPKNYDVYLLNVGAPIKRWPFKEKNHQFQVNSLTIIELTTSNDIGLSTSSIVKERVETFHLLVILVNNEL